MMTILLIVAGCLALVGFGFMGYALGVTAKRADEQADEILRRRR